MWQSLVDFDEHRSYRVRHPMRYMAVLPTSIVWRLIPQKLRQACALFCCTPRQGCRWSTCGLLPAGVQARLGLIVADNGWYNGAIDKAFKSWNGGVQNDG